MVMVMFVVMIMMIVAFSAIELMEMKGIGEVDALLFDIKAFD